MATTSIIARSTDREVIEALKFLGSDAGVSGIRLACRGQESFITFDGSVEEVANNAPLEAILNLNSYVIQHFQLGSSRQHIIKVDRVQNALHDQLEFNWGGAHDVGISAETFARMFSIAKDRLKELRVNPATSYTGADGFDSLVRARSAELDRLEEVSANIIRKLAEHRQELEKQFEKRRADLEARNEELRQKQLEAIYVERAEVAKRKQELDEREAALDLTDSKAARRALRKMLLETLGKHSASFALSPTTQKTRWPVAIVLTLILAASGFMAFSSFQELASAIATPGTEWWKVATVSVKQLFFAATFLGFATYTLRWFESWSKRHADAEFRFKQLELDIDRASWVVEVALEWRQQQGAELPKELLAQLSNHLFSDAHADADASSGNEVLAMLLGGSTDLKLDMPGGQLTVGRKGLRGLSEKVRE